MERAWQAALLAVFVAPGAFAQASQGCPSLPVDTGLKWERLEGPGFVFCKAVRDGGGGEVFAVTLSSSSPFKPDRRNRAEAANIAGKQDYWYRGEIGGSAQKVREMLLDLGNGQLAHISLHAADEQQLSQAMQQAEGLRFEDLRLSVK